MLGKDGSEDGREDGTKEGNDETEGSVEGADVSSSIVVFGRSTGAPSNGMGGDSNVVLSVTLSVGA